MMRAANIKVSTDAVTTLTPWAQLQIFVYENDPRQPGDEIRYFLIENRSKIDPRQLGDEIRYFVVKMD